MPWARPVILAGLAGAAICPSASLLECDYRSQRRKRCGPLVERAAWGVIIALSQRCGESGQHGRKRHRAHFGLAGRRAGWPAIPRSRCCTAFANAVTRPDCCCRAASRSSTRCIRSMKAAPSSGRATRRWKLLVSEYGPSTTGNSAEQWHQSPFYHLLQGSDNELRRRLETDEPTGFAVIDELRHEGQTDYIAMVQRFGREAAIGEMDCFLSRWLTMRPGGFSDADIDALRRLVPVLGLAIKSTSLARVAQSLVETYLGRDAGRRVLARPHVTRLRGKDPCRAVVLGHPRLHRAVRGHGVGPADPAARRLRRSGDLGGARRRRRCAEADRRRRAGDLRRRRSGSGKPLRPAGRGRSFG